VPGQLKANLAGTVAFRVRSEVNSHILLESDRAALLPHHPAGPSGPTSASRSSRPST